MNQASKSPLPGTRVTARAFFVAERINTAGLERGDVLSTAPLAFRVGDNGVAVLFRYGVVVLIGLNALEEDEFLRGPICLQSLSPERLILVGEALAKSVVLARHEREVSAVFDKTEPFARELARSGGMAGGRRAILQQIGNALSVQHRVTGPVAVSEKPDILWDKPSLERLYARLEDEYELKERAEALNRKLGVVAETAQVLTDIID